MKLRRTNYQTLFLGLHKGQQLSKIRESFRKLSNSLRCKVSCSLDCLLLKMRCFCYLLQRVHAVDIPYTSLLWNFFKQCCAVRSFIVSSLNALVIHAFEWRIFRFFSRPHHCLAKAMNAVFSWMIRFINHVNHLDHYENGCFCN